MLEMPVKAAVYDAYGSPLRVIRIAEVEDPVPGPKEVLVRVFAASVNRLDLCVTGIPYALRPLRGLRAPRHGRLGRDVAGRVEAVGRDVIWFRPGDEVFGVCRGAFAELACASEWSLAPKPPNVSFEQAAAAPTAGGVALSSFVHRGRLRGGYRILVNGATGGVGSFAVQIARHFDMRVTGVCSVGNVDLVRTLGADSVFAYGSDDFTLSLERFNFIVDCVGDHSLLALRRALARRGACVAIGTRSRGRWLGPLPRRLAVRAMSLVGRRFIAASTHVGRGELSLLGRFMSEGWLRPVMDVRRGLDEVPAAVAHVGEGHARGKVVITVVPSDAPPDPWAMAMRIA